MAAAKKSRLKVDDAVDISSLPDYAGTWGADLVNPFAAPKAADAPEKGPGMLRSMGDSAVALGRGAVTGARLISDSAGADNPVSQKLRSAEQAISSLESPQRTAERAQRAQIIRDAVASGSTGQEIMAYLGSFTDAPVDTLLEAFGTSAPTVITALIPGAGGAAMAARAAATLGMGAAQGAGSAKSQIYDSVKQGLTEKGVAPAEAERRAAEAQSYSGPNKDQIGVGAVLGAAAGKLGVEGAVGRMVGGREAAGGMLRRAATGAVAEGIPEAAQGGQEQLAGNIAQQREGLDVPPMQGVAGSAALEGVAGGGLGGAAGAVESRAGPPTPAFAPITETAQTAPAAPADGPLTRAAKQAVPAPAADSPATPAAAAQQIVDPLAERLAGITGAIKGPRLQQLRDQFGGQAATDALRTLTQAADSRVPANVREQALDSLDQLLARVDENYRPDWQTVEENPALPAPAASSVPLLEDSRKPVMMADERGNVAPASAEWEADATNRRNVSQIEAERAASEAEQRRIDLGMGRARPLATQPAPVAAPANEAIDAPWDIHPETGQITVPVQPQPPKASPPEPVKQAVPISSPQDAFKNRRTWKTVNEVSEYLSGQRRTTNTRMSAKPVARADGTGFTFAIKGESEYDALPDARKEKTDAAAGPAEVAAVPGSDVGTSAGPADTGNDRPIAASAPGVAGGDGSVEHAAVEPPAGTAGGSQNSPVEVAGKGRAGPVATDFIRKKDGSPFKTRNAADFERSKKPNRDEWEVIEVGGGFVGRRKATSVDEAAHQAATSTKNDLPDPTPAQREAENFKAGHTKIGDLDVTVQVPQGSKRFPDAPPITGHYGHLKRTTGADGENVDVWVAPGTAPDDSGPVYVIDQRRKDGSFDEHKVVIGAGSEKAARKLYLANMPKDWNGLGAITEMSRQDFRTWLGDGDLSKPAAETTVSGEGRLSFSKGNSEGSASVDRVQAVVDRIVGKWKGAPDVEVHASIDDAPDEIRAESGKVEGWYADGKVHLVAGNLATDADVQRVLFHEVLGHHGLQGVFGSGLKSILGEIAARRPRDISAKIKEYGLDPKADRLVAAEEVLATLAQSHPEMPFVQRAIAAVRTFLRKLGVGLKLTDKDLIAQYILPARRFVEQGNFSAAASTPRYSKAAPVGSTAFARWFGRSKVVDADGKPLRVFHGTDQDFSTFAAGAYFTDKAQASGTYARVQTPGAEHAPNVMPVFLKILKPKRFDTYATRADIAAAKASGRYDGVIVSNFGGRGETNYVTFSPEQVKSATGNSGAFDGDNPDIRFSKALSEPGGPTPDEVSAGATGVSNFLLQAFRDSRRNGRTFKAWRGINTQYHKASIDSDYKRVFDAAQQFSRDVSKLANEAADLAPTLLPNIANLKDIAGKSRVSEKDLAAVSKAVFEGTLADRDPARGTVWTDAQLRSRFGMTDRQVDLYHEFRAAVVRSLDDFGKAELIRFAGDHAPKELHAEVMEAKDVWAGARLITAALRKKLEYVETPSTRRDIEHAIADLEDKATRVTNLKNGGYAPLMRFGNYAVWIQHEEVDDDGKKVMITDWFSTHDSLRNANETAREMFQDIKTEQPNAVLKQGVMSQQEHKLFAGVTPDTLEVFGASAGFDGSPEWKAYIELVKNNRSALKRMLERKGTPGFNKDLTRVLAGFVTSNARATAGNIHSGEMLKAVEAIPQKKGDVKDEAVKLVEYLRNPGEEAPALRGLLFNWFLGGSIASAAVNLTQPLTMTLPYLAVKDGAVKAAARLAQASKDVLAGKYEQDLRDALTLGEKEGVVEPQEMHSLQAEVSRNLGSNLRLRKFLFAWGYLFQAAERFNRRTTFVAAYRQAREQGDANPFGAAEKAVIETQGVYARHNRPNWARGAVGATLFTFKQYSIGYVEFVARLLKNKESRPAGLLALGVLVALSGLSGLPGAEDLDDIIDTLAQAAGYNFQVDEAKREFLASVFGEQLAEFALRGVSSTGIPIDIQQRMGLGNLIPGTGAFKKSIPSSNREVMEVFGAAGGAAQQVTRGVDSLLRGEPGKAVSGLMPVAIANVLKAYDMAQTGQYRDQRGRRVTDVSMSDAVWKGVGFQPAGVALTNRREGDLQSSIQITRKTETEIAGRWAEGLYEKDDAKVKAARAALADWNSKNPETPIRITPTQIRSRVKQMGLTRSERIVKATPKEMRASVAAALKEQ